jgi:hypothetical protein
MSDSKDRDSKGRFKPGWRGGPGNPRVRHLAEIQAAIHQAVEPRVIEGVIKRLAKLALEGDVAAAKVFLDRVVGRPREAQSGGAFTLPPIDGVGDIPAALTSVLNAAAAGKISTEDATRYAAVLELTRRSVETAEFEARLKRMEEQQGLAPLRLATGS